MTNDIDANLARAMGYKTDRYCTKYIKIREDCWECGLSCSDSEHKIFWRIRYYDSGNDMGYFSPSTRWDHIGVVIEFIEKEKHKKFVIEKDDSIIPIRHIYFGLRNEFVRVPMNTPLTPLHIAKAALKALEEKRKVPSLEVWPFPNPYPGAKSVGLQDSLK